MKITFTPEHEAMIREKIDSGRYANIREVVCEALRLMERLEKERRLQAAISVGIEAADRYDVVELTPELADQIFQEAETAVRAGEQPDPDVAF